MISVKFIFLLVLLYLFCPTPLCQETCSDYAQSIVPDCNCTRNHVQEAVVHFIQPLLAKITASRYFRYFFVDLDKPCPFWHEEAVCMMEGCSVCPCDASELPSTWLQPDAADSYGWVTSPSSLSVSPYSSPDPLSSSLDQVTVRAQEGQEGASVGDQETGRALNQRQRESGGYLHRLHVTEDCDTLREYHDLAFFLCIYQ